MYGRLWFQIISKHQILDIWPLTFDLWPTVCQIHVLALHHIMPRQNEELISLITAKLFLFNFFLIKISFPTFYFQCSSVKFVPHIEFYTHQVYFLHIHSFPAIPSVWYLFPWPLFPEIMPVAAQCSYWVYAVGRPVGHYVKFRYQVINKHWSCI